MGLRNKIRGTLSLFPLLGITRQCEDEDGMTVSMGQQHGRKGCKGVRCGDGKKPLDEEAPVQCRPSLGGELSSVGPFDGEREEMMARPTCVL